MKPSAVAKIEGNEFPVPKAWRPALKVMADAMVLGSPLLTVDGFIIGESDEELLRFNRRNIDDYPDTLAPLTEASWNSSFRVWNEGHWKLLLDLITETGAVSDLVLHAKVTERGEAYAIEPGLIYVP